MLGNLFVQNTDEMVYNREAVRLEFVLIQVVCTIKLDKMKLARLIKAAQLRFSAETNFAFKTRSKHTSASGNNLHP